MKILITGGAGFIGSNFIHYIHNKYPTYEIVNVDFLTYAGNLENLKSVEDSSRYAFIHGDISDCDSMKPVFTNHTFDRVINFAAESHVDRSISQPDCFVKANVVGTQTLLDLAKEYQVPKFIQVSTDEVYGSLGKSGYFTEETPLAPNSPYSASKAASDLLVYSYYKTYEMDVNITRCSNNYGPYQFPEKLIPLMITNVLEEKKLPVYGDGKNIRDWLHVKDHCSAIDLVMHQGVAGEIYNIGGNNERENLELIQKIVCTLEASSDLIEYIEDRPGHDRRYAIDAHKISTELGWKPVYTFDVGLEETIDWYLSNKEWWKRIKSGDYTTYYQNHYQMEMR